MLTTVLEIAVLLAILVIPMAGPKKNNKQLNIDRNVTNAHYAIDEDGNLVELHGRELSRHEH
ncbi:MAG TPA: hypothetical protein VG367_00745 [Mucilaginibacter sp.]|jgi:hypothetical protein|nr:hypothetical protein [Mucilaginibacter sp.]